MDPKIEELIMAAFLVAQKADLTVPPSRQPYFVVDTDRMARLDDALIALGHTTISEIRNHVHARRQAG